MADGPRAEGVQISALLYRHLALRVSIVLQHSLSEDSEGVCTMICRERVVATPASRRLISLWYITLSEPEARRVVVLAGNLSLAGQAPHRISTLEIRNICVMKLMPSANGY
jgi:hypothetical protein